MKNIHIENSYNIWSTDHMKSEIIHQCHIKYGSMCADKVLNRTWKGMFLEWYLHNIGYYVTLPFIKNETLQFYNNRFKHVDIEEHR